MLCRIWLLLYVCIFIQSILGSPNLLQDSNVSKPVYADEQAAVWFASKLPRKLIPM